MGYSCSALANMTLDALQESVRSENSGNCFIDKDGRERFWEIGRENVDGSITGRVWIFTDDDSKGKGSTREITPKGSFKINQHGKIERFPGIKKSVRDKTELAGAKKFKDTFSY